MNTIAHRLDLSALDGANPLGFLCALGIVHVMSASDSTARLGWKRTARWTPFLQSQKTLDENSVVQMLAEHLRGTAVHPEAEKERAASQSKLDDAKKKLKDALAAFKKRKLRGKEREAAWQKEIEPLRRRLSGVRSRYLATLRQAVPSPELAIGQPPDCTIEEFRGHARALLTDAAVNRRTAVDLLAAFGAETVSDSEARIEATPFCFITGGGHQWFLDTARQLMTVANPKRVQDALFHPWAYADEKLSMRWDPIDDRRYALLDRDPTASDNKSRTVWMANLLAYRALAFYPCSLIESKGHTPGWASEFFTWPIWDSPLGTDTIRSLICHPALGKTDLAAYRGELRARGVATIFRSRRIRVGKYVNFSQAFVV